MRTYEELVKEAIEKAKTEYEEMQAAKEHKEQQALKFEVGKTYFTRSICDHNCIFKATIVKRTAKTVIIDEGDGKLKRCKIHTDLGEDEAIFPHGVYSMCPIIHSKNIAA